MAWWYDKNSDKIAIGSGNNETKKHQKATGSQSLIVAAFDVGTTYSGYAFSFKQNPQDIITNKSWYANSGNLVSLKTSTSVLINQDDQFDSFGFDAEEKYSFLASKKKHHGWRLFQRFKMALHDPKIFSCSPIVVKDLEGKTYPAKSIFVMSIRFLQKHLLSALELSKTGTRETDIRYILTVPAIWGIAAKQFMREAAIEAGIDSDRLKLALEPEAAAICCEALGHTLARTKFMVVDLGGGTADISVHERQADGSLKNTNAPSGGPWGGIYVDANFINFMAEIFGTDALTALQAGEMYDYFDLIRDFEVKKRRFDYDSETTITFRIPGALNEKDQSLSQRLASLNYDGKVFARGNDKLGVHSSIMQSWFAGPVSKMVNHISSLLKEERMADVGIIVLVGRFAESPYVQQRIQKAFPERRLIVPGEVGLAVLKGAVMFGHKPDIISSRVMDYTYGIHTYDLYENIKHDGYKKIYDNGICKVDIFDIFVRVGAEVLVDSRLTHTSRPREKRSCIPIHRTKEKKPLSITDDGCELLGELWIDHDVDIPLEQQVIETAFMFGDTELHVSCKNIETGRVETLTLNLRR